MDTAQKERLKENPRERANILSILTFWWTIDLFRTGYRKALEIPDLFKPLDEDKSDLLGDRLERQWFKQCEKNKRPSLIKAIFYTCWKGFTLLGVLTIINDVVFRIGQPLMLGTLLKYFRQEPEISREEALYYAAGIVLLNALSSISINQYVLTSFQTGMKVRIAVCSAIYRKSLRLSRTALGDTSAGKVVNLLSNDVNRFDICTIFLHSMWSAPLLTLVVGYLIWRESGWGGMVGMFVIFTVTPIQAFTGKLSSKYRLQTALRTDERVRLMDEIISGVQVIKMYAWEQPFAKLIALARKLELKIVRKNSYVRALYMTFMLFTTRMALFCTMVAIVVANEKLTASRVFVTAAYYQIISHTMSQMFVRGVAEIAEALVAMRRLQSYLELEEKEKEKKEKEKREGKDVVNGDALGEHKLLIESSAQLPSGVALAMKNATARWAAVKSTGVKAKSKGKGENGVVPVESLPYTLKNINLEFKRGKLIGVIGPVGAGKSSLLQAILRELPLESGSIAVKGRISYAAQEPWVFAGSVRQNILFGEEFDKDRYDVVVKSCALLRDFEELSYGDRTIIGERGASLSGGQKARISMARACYRKADVYLLDDPLSAVDAHVGRHLFDECIGSRGRLGRQRATRILVTHQIHFLKEADYIVMLRDGKVERTGSPHELAQSGIDFASLLESEEYNEANSEYDKMSSRDKRSRTMSQSSSASITGSFHSLTDLEDDKETKDERRKSTEPEQNVEMSSKGTVKGSVGANYIRAAANPIILFGLFILFIATQICASAADFWAAYWTAQEELKDFIQQNDTNPVEFGNETQYDPLLNGSDVIQVDGLTDDVPNILSTETCMYIYAGLMVALFFLAIIRSISYYSRSVKASQVLHDAMFKGVVSSPMRFFDLNPSGRILNRFSKDMGAVDELLPKAFLDASQIILMMFGSIVVTALVNWLLLLPLALLGVVFMWLRKIYLKTSKNIKRLEGITRSPVFTHLAATLNGLATIRAFNAQEILTTEFDNQQDTHTASWYMFITTSTAFGFGLDLICNMFFFCVTFSFLIFPGDYLGDRVGLAITQVMAMTGLVQWGIRQSAEVANQLMGVERILEYRDLEPEKQPVKPVEPEKSWPRDGRIRFKNVSYSYVEGGEPVLRDLNFEIEPQEKIGIVGRTGAGKSSLIGALFRIAQVEGEIYIDGIDTARVRLQLLRSKISIIPQDPVLFSGSLRRNLDPFEEYPDENLWQALDEVELKDIASGPLGLQTLVATGGSNFSVGQRQLVCLARAILRNNRILVLDEATANVDPITDELIQKTIRTRFAHCTVLTIAHRLHTIMDSDRVLVMDAGRAEEFAPPYELCGPAAHPMGIFKEMVEATGQTESEHLITMAKEKYNEKKNV